ncbi:MAG: SMC-Scp complex subunit ScpB [Burkholderiaceae bacterium]
MNTTEITRILEVALLCAQGALRIDDFKRLFDDEYGADLLEPLLNELREQWADRPLELVRVASGWRFQSRPQYAPYLQRLAPERAPRYSRAALETLAIIAYRQPVTRGEIEEIRASALADHQACSRTGLDRCHRSQGSPAAGALGHDPAVSRWMTWHRPIQELPPIEHGRKLQAIEALGQRVIEPRAGRAVIGWHGARSGAARTGRRRTGRRRAGAGNDQACSDQRSSDEAGGDRGSDGRAQADTERAAGPDTRATTHAIHWR